MYEYDIIVYRDVGHAKEWLNEKGTEGWELVAVVDRSTYIFKRRRLIPHIQYTVTSPPISAASTTTTHADVEDR